MMASQIIREWTGIQQFPPATQTKMFELLGKLKQEVLFSISLLNQNILLEVEGHFNIYE